MKNYRIILLFAAIVAVLGGCAKNNISEGNANNGKGLVFTATIGEPESKTLISETGKVTWEEGDIIEINGILYTAIPDSENPAVATFEKTNPEDADPELKDGKYYASYKCSYDGETGFLSEQRYDGNSIAEVAPMIAVSGSTKLSFRNVCSLLEITLKGDATIIGINVSSSNNCMFGDFVLDTDGQTITLIPTEGIEPSYGVTLNCPGGALLTEEGTRFYVAVPAGTYQNLKISATDINLRTWSIVAPNAAEIGANKVYPLSFTPSFAENILLDSEFVAGTDGHKVKFVKGNLAYADGKYSICGIQLLAGTLFDASEIVNIKPEEFTDQPVRMLTSSEWSYILSHTNRLALKTYAGRYGLIIIPNDVDLTSQSEWSVLNAAGAVFLPAAGYAYGSSATCYANEGGSYWTVDMKSLDFDACEVYVGDDAPAGIKQAVRYVVDVEE